MMFGESELDGRPGVRFTLPIGGTFSLDLVTGPSEYGTPRLVTRSHIPPSKIPPPAAQSMLILMHSQTQTVTYYIGYPRTVVDDCTGLYCVARPLVFLSVALASRESINFNMSRPVVRVTDIKGST